MMHGTYNLKKTIRELRKPSWSFGIFLKDTKFLNNWETFNISKKNALYALSLFNGEQ